MNQTTAKTTTARRKTRRVPLANVAGLLIATALIGQVLGFMRTKLINANFNNPLTPPDQNAGVYFAAASIPDFSFLPSRLARSGWHLCHTCQIACTRVIARVSGSCPPAC